MHKIEINTVKKEIDVKNAYACLGINPQVATDGSESWVIASSDSNIVGAGRLTVVNGYQLIKDLVSQDLFGDLIKKRILAKLIQESHQHHSIWAVPELKQLGYGIFEQYSFYLMSHRQSIPHVVENYSNKIQGPVNHCIMRREPQRL